MCRVILPVYYKNNIQCKYIIGRIITKTIKKIILKQSN